MLINTMEEESLSEGMVSQITVEYKMFGSDKSLRFFPQHFPHHRQ